MYGMKGNIFEIFLNTVSLSILLAKASFAFLLISMFSYWFQAAFNFKYTKNRVLSKLPLVAMYSANLTLAFMLSLRWIESGHFPLSNLYESLLFLSWSLTSVHLFLESVVNKGEQVAPSLTLGAITSPLCLFTNAFATFSLPQEMQKITVLVPALQSNWLIMHVSVMIISYAALLSGSLLAMAFLVSRFVEDTKIGDNLPFNIVSLKNTTYSVPINPYFSHVRNTFASLLHRLLPVVRSSVPVSQTISASIPKVATPLAAYPASQATKGDTIFDGKKHIKQDIFNGGASHTTPPMLLTGCASQPLLRNPKVVWGEKQKDGIQRGGSPKDCIPHVCFLPVVLRNPEGERSKKMVSEGEKHQKLSPKGKEAYVASPSVRSKMVRSIRGLRLQFEDAYEGSKNNEVKELVGEKRGIMKTQSTLLANSINCLTSTPSKLKTSSKTANFLTPYCEILPINHHNASTLSSNLVDEPMVNKMMKHPFKRNLSQTLDNLSYRSIGLGFALLTIGILSGAVWANEAWGSYWSWDPKETWAFVTWLVFAFYLHTRLSKGWVGKESAFVAIFGFAIIWFCYLGVNFFGKGLHSYGWFQTIR